ncbi:MAG: RNA methyltransferase [Gammaproteobacteria bacterium]|nr:RNA methyltransferase [Gammaproteobacteria bacterium]
MWQNVRIVLVEPSHPGNIGAAARAMKTMGLSRLYLVAPRHPPGPETIALASGADEVVRAAVTCAGLEEAIADCHLVVGTTARVRRHNEPGPDPRGCARELVATARHQRVGLVFGREQAGLTNAELDRCHYRVHIPANPDYSSLNLAAAVQIMAYEIRRAAELEGAAPVPEVGPLAPAEMLEGLFGHLEQALIDIEFLYPDNPRHLMRRLRHLLNRARLTADEVNILRGILSAAQRKAGAKPLGGRGSRSDGPQGV